MLLANHAYADFANAKGTTALMRASQEGHEGVCELLISHGADVNRKNLEGMNSLMLASQRGLASMVTYLINSNAYVDDQTSQGSTALMLASKRGHKACVEVLVFRGAEIYMKDLRGRTARDTATKKSFLTLLNILDTQKQIQIIQQDIRQTRTALLYALKQAFENNALTVSGEEQRAMVYLRSLFQRQLHSAVNESNEPMRVAADSPNIVRNNFANGNHGASTDNEGYSNGRSPPAPAMSATAALQFHHFRRQALSTSPVTSISSTPPVEAEEPASFDNSPVPRMASNSGVVHPKFDKFCLPDNAKATILAELRSAGDQQLVLPGCLKGRTNRTAEWEWPLTLMRYVNGGFVDHNSIIVI
jgi:hypothetical protein